MAAENSGPLLRLPAQPKPTPVLFLGMKHTHAAKVPYEQIAHSPVLFPQTNDSEDDLK